MFLSANVSQLEPDGSLVVDLTDERGPVLRFGPLAEGMPWARLEGEYWVPTDHDYGVLLVNDAHERQRHLPVHRYLASVPADDLATLNRIRHAQATMLQLTARWPEARDLLRANPLLLWMVAERYVVEPKLRHRVPGLLLKPQREMLEWVLQTPVQPAQVRFLSKLVLTGSDAHTMALLRRFVADAEMVERLRHWRRVPSAMLGLVLEAPVVAELGWLRQEAAEAANTYDAGRVAYQYQRLLRDTVRMLGILNAADRGPGIDLRRYRSAQSVKALHERLIGTARRLGWGNLLASEVSPTQVFPDPPIPSGGSFEAITSVVELVKEAERMKHCVITRAPEVMSGACALYRANVAGERATLEISVGRNGEPLSIQEFRLACNEEPSEAAWRAAQQWLKDGREAWARRNAGR